MIITVPNSVLTTPAKEVKKVDKKVKQIIEEMKRVLVATQNPKGVGLAAPQIGVSLRIFITRPKETSFIRTFLNPQIIWSSPQLAEIKRENIAEKTLRKEKKLEGCLSIPEIWGYLKRPAQVKLKYMDTNGKWLEEEFEGFMATIVQHETDHLNGILFTQRVLGQNSKLYRIEKNEQGKEELVEVEI